MKPDQAKRNLHSGHRDRLKKHVITYGIDNWPEHQVLEFLLFFGIPQKNTNELAHKLIDEYVKYDGEYLFSYDEEDGTHVDGLFEKGWKVWFYILYRNSCISF